MRLTLLLYMALLGLLLQLPANAGVPRMHSERSATRAGVPHHGRRPAHGRARLHRAAGATASPQIDHALHVSRRHSRRLATKRVTTTAMIPELPLRAMLALPPMKGSRESLVRQNERNEREGLQRIADDQDLLTLRKSRQLVVVPTSAGLRVDERLPANRRYCRTWTSRFLADLSRAHYSRFQRSLQVNSAVRTVAYQRRLVEVNGNAAPVDGDIASPHLTGATIDIAKKGLSINEIGWMRAYLMPLQTTGKVDVEEEFLQSCFHITVYKSYLPLDAAPPVVSPAAPRRHSSTTLLAARVR